MAKIIPSLAVFTFLVSGASATIAPSDKSRPVVKTTDDMGHFEWMGKVIVSTSLFCYTIHAARKKNLPGRLGPELGVRKVIFCIGFYFYEILRILLN